MTRYSSVKRQGWPNTIFCVTNQMPHQNVSSNRRFHPLTAQPDWIVHKRHSNRVRRKFVEWIEKFCEGKYAVDKKRVYFELESDLLLFILKWGNSR